MKDNSKKKEEVARELEHLRKRLFEVDTRMLSMEYGAANGIDLGMYYALLKEKQNLEDRIAKLEKLL